MDKLVVALLTKPMDEIAGEDVRALIMARVPEGERIEFKRDLPVGKGKTDKWPAEHVVGEHAKRVILEEVVAFANAYGGMLVLGVEESKGKPAVAEGLRPITDCENLADRLKLVFRDGVEPQLPGLEVLAVPVKADGGVIVVRTHQSRLAPHRVRATKRCTVRRADRCEELTMREIQDMTLNVSRGLRRVEEKLAGRRIEFDRQCKILGNPSGAFGFRITAIPTGQDLRIDTVVRNGTIDERFAPPSVRVCRVTSDSEPDGEPLSGIESDYAMARQNWVPRLRAVCAETLNYLQTGELDRRAWAEVGCDGTIEIAFLSQLEIIGLVDLATTSLVDTVPVAELGIACMWADRVRSAAGAPGTEYAIEAEIRVTSGSALVEKESGVAGSRRGRSARLPAPGILFPKYSLGPVEESGVLCEMLERDFWNAMGKDIAANQGRILVSRL